MPAGRCEIDYAKEATPTKILVVTMKRGRDQATISTNIGRLISEGYQRDQAAAIAHDVARRSNKGKKK